ncbi:pseudaminic acid cytidylyltransferase [Faucicola atlantae]|uniref:Pseudaminic acid cytidylyltransferase n=1 Tax=Faucicola atlantae TaxID=34059 RepID=A0A1B8QL44_9GAMM|nr:pseudaminic acid cytidylyltransferase [Moraxella atlantae]OBX84296.1 pseudaminic acid cytidylyltransferase [Moraxella atlantae]
MNSCIIPARGGSKRIPHKNSKDFCGKPMLAHAIATAQASQLFDQIYVSTDDAAIADIAHAHGAQVVLRPAKLADDYATTVAVIRHAIAELGLSATTNVCCLYPCTPLLPVSAIIESWTKWQQSDRLYCLPVLAFESSILRALQLNHDHQLASVFSQYEQSRTQDLPQAYHDAGQFYWGKAATWLTEASIHNHAIGFVLPKHSVVDIDEEADWQFAEMVYRLRHGADDARYH